MKIHRFFIEEPITETIITLNDPGLLNQWRNVLRLKSGDRVVLLDNTEFEFECTIEQIEKKQAILSISRKIQRPWQPAFDLELIQSIIKKDRFEWLLEKGTELGVNRFSPIISQRSVRQKINTVRAKKILRESSEQSERSKLPEINNVKNLEGVLKEKEEEKFYFVLDPKGESFEKKFLTKTKLSIFVGPEGGFDDSELEIFKKEKIPIYSLGGQILRAETAAVAIASLALLSH